MKTPPFGILRPSTPPPSYYLGFALLFGLIGAAVISLGVALLRLALSAEVGPAVGATVTSSSLLFLVLFPLLTLGAWMYKSRRAQDAGFGWIGFFATFFGLAILFFFLCDLTVQVYEYFTEAPALIRESNQNLADRVAKQEKMVGKDALNNRIEKLKKQEAAELKGESDPKEIAAIKSDYKKLIDEAQEEVDRAQRTLDEMINERDRGLRTKTSVWSILVYFLSSPPSDNPQDAGIWPALLGSLWISLITILFAVPVGVGAALYLEEYKQTGWLQRLIQLNINNLAGVPSVVYGILGSFVFVGMIFRPLSNWNSDWFSARNLVGGGLTLGLMTLPVVIVAAQEAIRAVPQSIRHGAYALGATRWQTIWALVLPSARPGIMTGTILAVSRAIGEAAPLVLFGANQLVSSAPNPLSSPFTILPLQIFNWAGRPEDIWKGVSAMAIVVLLILLLSLNALAIYLRNRAQKSIRA